jgi:Tfp pilus assembly protein FimT
MHFLKPLRARRATGISAIEIMVVIGIMGTMMAIAAPRFSSLMGAMRISSASRQIATDLQLARMRAIAQHTAYTVTFTSSYAYTLGTGATDARDFSQLYPGTSFVGGTPANMTFTSVGTLASAATLTLSNNYRSQQIQVSTLGKVTLPH